VAAPVARAWPHARALKADHVPELPGDTPSAALTPDLRGQLRHVYWLGGSPCAGKSSVARIIAERHHLRLYSCDDHFEEHKARVDPGRQRVFASLIEITCDELWMRPVGVQVETELGYCRDVFGLILEDLLALPSSQPLLAEGTDLLPECVAPLLSSPRHAFWLVPTIGFQYNYYSQRDWVHDILKDCSQPAKAFSNWMGRDAGFADKIEKSASNVGLPVMRVDGSLSAIEIAGIVQQSFGLAASS
jgi:hypothetical protein